MTMQRPHPRIIHIELQDHIAGNSLVLRIQHGIRQDVRIPPLGITRVDDRVTVVITVAFVEDEEIVAVEVHRMGGMIGSNVATEN